MLINIHWYSFALINQKISFPVLASIPTESEYIVTIDIIYCYETKGKISNFFFKC